jgi:hypothetical protein
MNGTHALAAELNRPLSAIGDDSFVIDTTIRMRQELASFGVLAREYECFEQVGRDKVKCSFQITELMESREISFDRLR